MCGIAGVLSAKEPVKPSILENAARFLSHRGPDDVGTHKDGHLGFLHTRLSIIDIKGGHQPLSTDTGNLTLIANGEIYNHVELRKELEARGHHFSTRSDCETILHAYAEYGLDFLRYLNGMFAFALYDRRNQRLILGRDRLGIKPLFFVRTDDYLAFASEIKVLKHLIPIGLKVCPAGLAQYLQNQFVSGRDTLLEDVKKILPGEFICIDTDLSISYQRYWSLRNVEPLETDFEEASERFDAIMEIVIRQHMRADVPYGLFLSGGVDSSILLALLSRFSNRAVRTLSVGFPGTRIVDDLPDAERLANQFNSQHTTLQESASSMLLRLPYTVWAADDLMQDYANLPTSLLAESAGKELKVVFTGEGGDEVFAGYGRYRMSVLERGVHNILAPGSGGFRTHGVFRRQWLQRLFGDELRSVSEEWRQPFVRAWQEGRQDWSTLQRMQYTDMVTALPDNLLVKVDRMLMASAVEGRVPFLDHRVVEFGLALPDRLKVDRKQGKIFLKRWASRYLPEEVLWKRKRGFAVPVGEWLRGQFLDRLGEVLPEQPLIRRWFKPDGIRYLVDRQRHRGGVTRLVWTIFQFAVWHALIVEGDGSRPPAQQDPVDLLS